MIEVLCQFMDIEVSNNLIWGHPEEFTSRVLLECGYEVTDWSWYDGHLVSCKTPYPELIVQYTACSSGYYFITGDELPSITIQLEEIGKLASEERRNMFNFNSIDYYQQTEDGTGQTKVHLFNPSPEFNRFVTELYNWKKTFDKSPDFDYTVGIYFGKEIDLNEL